LHDARTKLRKEIMMEDSRENEKRIVVRLRGVSLKPLEDDSPRLENINMEVEEGEFYVLTGPLRMQFSPIEYEQSGQY